MAAIARVFSEEALALDASYSRPFAFLNEVSEFVVGADAKRYDTEYDAGAARGFATNNVFDPNPHGIPEPDIAASQNSDTRERELGTYAKLTLRPWSGLALIGGARLSWYQLDSDVTNLNNGSSTRDHTSIAGRVTPYAGWCRTWIRTTPCTSAIPRCSSRRPKPAPTAACSSRAKATSWNWASRAATCVSASTPA